METVARIDGVVVHVPALIPDDRGYVLEVLRRDAPFFQQFGQVYVSATYPGVVKAWHHHTRQTDVFVCIAGMVKLVLYDSRPESPTRSLINEYVIGDQRRLLVTVPPGVLHGWKCISDTMALVINVPTEPYCYDDPDEQRVDAHGVVPYDWTRRDR